MSNQYMFRNTFWITSMLLEQITVPVCVCVYTYFNNYTNFRLQVRKMHV